MYFQIFKDLLLLTILTWKVYWFVVKKWYLEDSNESEIEIVE